MRIPAVVEVLDQITGSYQPDPVHSRLGFAARYAMVTTVHGWFDSFGGRVHLDGHDPRNCSVALTIDAASIRTNNPDRDAHLRSAVERPIDNRLPSMIVASTRQRSGIKILIAHIKVRSGGVQPVQ